MGGEIGVESVPGRGSTFWLTLPLGAAAPADERQKRPDLSGVRALVVDDNETNRLVLRRFLESWDVQHDEADGAAAAVAAISAAADAGTPYEIVLVDLHMPDVDGFSLARTIRSDARLDAARLVLLTSSGQRGEASLAQEAGMSAYLTKPVHPDQLRACLITVLGEHSVEERRSLVTRHHLAAAPHVRGSILVAEDNVVNQRVAVGMLQSLHYSVDVVDNGADAVVAAARTRYDIIFMDCQMPVLDGYAATARIRAFESSTRRRTPIVALTASAMAADRRRCLEAGMDDHLAKPLRRAEVSAILTRLPQHDAGDDPGVVAIDRARPSTSDEPVPPRAAVDGATITDAIRVRLDELFEGFDGDIAAEGNELLASFCDRAAEALEELADAAGAGDTGRCASLAHSIKGMAANVGVDIVARAAAGVEDAARDDDLLVAARAFATLRDALAQATRVIAGMSHSDTAATANL